MAQPQVQIAPHKLHMHMLLEIWALISCKLTKFHFTQVQPYIFVTTNVTSRTAPVAGSKTIENSSCGWAGPADKASHPVHRMHDSTDNPKPSPLERTPALVTPAGYHIPGMHQPQPCGAEPAKEHMACPLRAKLGRVPGRARALLAAAQHALPSGRLLHLSSLQELKC